MPEAASLRRGGGSEVEGNYHNLLSRLAKRQPRYNPNHHTSILRGQAAGSAWAAVGW
jgi:hypothetical protein